VRIVVTIDAIFGIEESCGRDVKREPNIWNLKCNDPYSNPFLLFAHCSSRRSESFQYGPRYLSGFMLGKAVKLFQEQQGNEDHTLIFSIARL
jgi:hypothetical protein